jgi:heme/copper-type cytochrome/quinol oxidase subunit 3
VNEVQPKVEHKTCFKCDFEADTSATVCPRCGKTLKSSRNLRLRGGIMIFTGGFLILFMGAIAAFIGYLVFFSSSRSNFTGTRNELILIFSVFGFVILFGVVALATGACQLISGRRNQFLVWLMLGLVFIMIFGGTLISLFLN